MNSEIERLRAENEELRKIAAKDCILGEEVGLSILNYYAAKVEGAYKSATDEVIGKVLRQLAKVARANTAPEEHPCVYLEDIETLAKEFGASLEEQN